MMSSSSSGPGRLPGEGVDPVAHASHRSILAKLKGEEGMHDPRPLKDLCQKGLRNIYGALKDAATPGNVKSSNLYNATQKRDAGFAQFRLYQERGSLLHRSSCDCVGRMPRPTRERNDRVDHRSCVAPTSFMVSRTPRRPAEPWPLRPPGRRPAHPGGQQAARCRPGSGGPARGCRLCRTGNR